MTQNPICKKVSAILSLYIEDNLTDKEKSFVEEHLKNCENCKNKYTYLKYLINDLKSSYKQIQELSLLKQNKLSYSINEHEKFLNNISPYVDNELNNQDCISLKKHLLKSSSAQKELKNLYYLQNKLHSSFDTIKSRNPKSVANNIIKSLKKRNQKHKTQMLKNTIFSTQSLKIAILAGLLVLGGYEIEELLNQNSITKQRYEQKIIQQNQIKTSVLNFIKTFDFNP